MLSCMRFIMFKKMIFRKWVSKITIYINQKKILYLNDPSKSFKRLLMIILRFGIIIKMIELKPNHIGLFGHDLSSKLYMLNNYNLFIYYL